MLTLEGMGALCVALVLITVLAAAILVLVGGWSVRGTWEVWRDAVLSAVTYGRRGRWPL
jgi:hypothetical protein